MHLQLLILQDKMNKVGVVDVMKWYLMKNKENKP
jgi:hypothetical protein